MFCTSQSLSWAAEVNLRLRDTPRSDGRTASQEPDAALLASDFDARDATLLELMRYPMSGRRCDPGGPRELAQRDPLTARA